VSYHRVVLITLLKWCSEDRVRKGADKLAKYLGAKQQGRLDGFFRVQPKSSPDAKKDTKKGAPAAKGSAKGKKRKVCCSLNFCLSERLMRTLQADEDGAGSSKKKRK
jgi:hypothetical protein